MDCDTRARTWNFLVLIQDCSIAAIMTAVLAFLLSIDTLLELLAIFTLCYITVRMYYRVTWTKIQQTVFFFSGLTKNRILRKYLFGNNANGDRWLLIFIWRGYLNKIQWVVRLYYKLQNRLMEHAFLEPMKTCKKLC